MQVRIHQLAILMVWEQGSSPGGFLLPGNGKECRQQWDQLEGFLGQVRGKDSDVEEIQDEEVD